MFKFNSNAKNYIFRIAPLAILLVMFGVILNEEQNKKEVLYQLFHSAQAADNQNEVRFYRYLKDINCSMMATSSNDKKVLQMYIKVFEDSISNMLTESHTSQKTKGQIESALEYIPCECKTGS
ncbi:hypothetical protein L2755_09370 [Shewanella abyssi]|uniref:hypothetical protein n=1 Tax=Shewanella abyssi TaxID=311789 RepID=UPI00200F5943|nr:hypothetical protein [Shewanella abyssi]MCL1049829.1 hypothetical protein [Shewanella abyssi]